jgi:hypothetical protein
LKNFTKNRYVMYVASHKHEHLKGLIGQGGPLCLQDVLALTEDACVMEAAATSSSSFLHASICNSMISLTALTQSRSASRGPKSFLIPGNSAKKPDVNSYFITPIFQKVPTYAF